jgi:uncharacterized protein
MSSPAEFSLPLSELDAGGKAFEFPVRTAWLKTVLEATDVNVGTTDGKLSLRASKSHNDVVVHGRLEAHVTVPCARCLSPAAVDVDQQLSVMLVPASTLREDARAAGKGKARDGDAEESLEDADVLPYSGENAVLDDLVRDEILLAIPMIPLCSEDCPGIHPSPQAPAEEKAVDPRLAPLLRLKKMTKE